MARLTPSDIERAQAESGFTRIEVDITSLGDFAKALRREVEENLRPAWGTIEPTLDQPAFGLSPLLELDDKRLMYEEYLLGAKDLFRSLIDGVEQLAWAAERIAADYQGADQLAQVTTDRVWAELPNLPMPTVRSDIPVAGTWRAE